MNFLMVLLAVMTWTIQSKNNVTGDGEWPYDIGVDYSCSYQKGTVRAGDEAVLKLSNLGAMTVESVVVFVSSNKSSGAGTFTVSAGDQSVAEKQVSYTALTPDPTLTEVTLLSQNVDGVDSLTISLVGTENSLHIDRYVITYSAAPARTVTLMNGPDLYTTLTEEHGYEGVTLPSLKDTVYWHFIGWSESVFWVLKIKPDVIPAGKKYFPKQDVTLWAVYEYQPEPHVYITELESGEYLYANIETNTALYGIPNDEGRMSYVTINQKDENQYYLIDFTASKDTAYITHSATNTPIGYTNQAKMKATASPWLVYHNEEETIFYAVIKKKTYILWLNIFDSTEGGTYAGLYNADPMNSPMRLLKPLYSSEETWTCHPESKLPVNNVQSTPQTEYTMPFGPFKLVIRDGQKYIQL